MFDFLKSFVGTLQSLIQFFINSVTGIIYFLTQIPTYVSFITDSLNLLPSILIPFGIMAVSIYVYLFVIGRNS